MDKAGKEREANDSLPPNVKIKMNGAIPLFPVYTSSTSKWFVIVHAQTIRPFNTQQPSMFRIYHHPTSHTPSSNGPSDMVTKLN